MKEKDRKASERIVQSIGLLEGYIADVNANKTQWTGHLLLLNRRRTPRPKTL